MRISMFFVAMLLGVLTQSRVEAQSITANSFFTSSMYRDGQLTILRGTDQTAFSVCRGTSAPIDRNLGARVDLFVNGQPAGQASYLSLDFGPSGCVNMRWKPSNVPGIQNNIFAYSVRAILVDLDTGEALDSTPSSPTFKIWSSLRNP